MRLEHIIPVANDCSNSNVVWLVDPDKDESADTRRSQIIEYIKIHPGTHLRKIKRELGVSMGVTQYHLYTLERERRIISRRTGMYKRFYINLVFGEKDQTILDILSQETEREILLFLIGNPNATLNLRFHVNVVRQ